MHTHYITAVMFTRCTNLYFVILVYSKGEKMAKSCLVKKCETMREKASNNRPDANLGKNWARFSDDALVKM